MKKNVAFAWKACVAALLLVTVLSFPVLALPASGQFQEGLQGAEITEIQVRLFELGYLEEKHITGYFGPITKEAVIAFQKDNQIEAIGVCGPKTLAALSRPAGEYRLGAEGDFVKKIQNRLYELGYMLKKHVTGYFGSITKAAVTEFQKDHSIDAIGICGPKTQQALFYNPADKLPANITLRAEDRGDNVKLLQQVLISKGYLGSQYATGYYGSRTTAAVKAFQKANGLSQDGVAGTKTIAKLKTSTTSGKDSTSSGSTTYYAKPGTLRLGDKGPLVTDLQNALNKKGYYSGSATGLFDNKTKSAVQAFQKANGLTQDGIVGSATYARLNQNKTPVTNTPTEYTKPDKARLDALYNSYSAAQKEDIDLLARLINAEAGGECYEGKVAVGSIVMNRVSRSKATIYQVIYAKNQFSVAGSAAMEKRPTTDSFYAAIDAYNGAKPVGNSLYFNMANLNNTWAARNRTLYRIIGVHAFYL